ncbi:MAG TPA: DUF6311 domain-containing protein [Puia sp.]
MWLLATVAVIIIYQFCYGLVTLKPSNISWLMSAHEDWGTHYLGWAYFKSEPWHFPFGKITGYNYPIGTNVGFTDSIPLMAIFFKIFSPLLSDDFQYFGIWLFICHLLAAYFTILLCRLFKLNRIVTLAAAIFIAASPVLVYRGMHPALCAQWLLIACIYFYFLDPQTTPTKRILSYQFVILIFSSLINPYLCWMVLGFTFAIPAKLCFVENKISRKYLFTYLAISLFTVVLLWYLTGLVEFGKKEDLGVGGAYGLYALNLNSLFNSGGFSSYFPQLKMVSWHQYEGYMYMGLGIFLLLSVLLFYYCFDFVRRKIRNEKIQNSEATQNKKLIPLYVLVALFTIFSITLVFTWSDKVLLRVPAPAFFVHLEEIFRASSRFFWTPYYLIVLFTIIGLAQSKIKPLITTTIIVAALLVQLYDIKPLLTFRRLPFGTYAPSHLDSKNWIQLMKKFDEILFYPAFESPKVFPMDYQDFAYLALKAGKPVNLAYVARADNRAMQLFSDSSRSRVENGRLTQKALYLTNAANLEHFNLAFQSNAAQLNFLDGCYYVFNKEPRDENLEALINKLNIPFRAKLDSALNSISKGSKFSETSKIPVADDKAIHYWLQTVNIGEKVISMEGFAFIDSTQTNKGDSIFVTLSSEDKCYMVRTLIVQRPDITAAFRKTYLDDAGFNFIAFTENVQKGTYQIGLAIKDTRGQFVYQPTDKQIKIKMPE